jgi:hypothetical protein
LNTGKTLFTAALPNGLSFGHNTKSHSLANFVGIVAGFLSVSIIRLQSLLLAAALSFECNLV